MARPGRQERNRTARSFGQLKRFHYGINSDKVFGTHSSLIIIIEGDPHLINRYDVIELNPAKHGPARLDAAKIFADWLVSPEGQQAIGAYQVDGQQLFNPSAASLK